MARVRTLIVTVPPLLRSLVLGVLQPHFEIDVVATMDSREGLADSIPPYAPDLVLFGLRDDEDDGAALTLLRAVPAARILALAPDGGRAWLHEMRPHRSAITPVSVAALIQSLQPRAGGSPPMD